ncbi:50S ribosomal protein L11 methyltransferase [Hyphobacterium sp. HN65]|uniref:50S ribosomal protein L11 methyltransferase n=1 Tax=Hyphobacterium lacteum TaxID=3116575 RepID=A0ABU7LN43_9PROT|nr:50S ribosomal protein L11 methyltransferase [Hyphobacterium sp. HN65]MEE2525322.1 50S ribosomal protein L11 methyltransferase [Hyphobacterium sp. HN65]
MLKSNESHAGFIRRTTRVLSPPLVPEMNLHLAEESIGLWSQTEEALGEAGLPPPFWAFAWAGGQALARYALDNPDQFSRRSVLDFAAGGGIAGIGAAMAGASQVEAAEIDDFAVAAIDLNAALNGASVTAANHDIIGEDRGWDIVLAADVFYEDRLSRRIESWLRGLHDRGALVLIGDPERHFLPKATLDCLAEYTVPVTRDLEDREIRNAKVWTFRA